MHVMAISSEGLCASVTPVTAAVAASCEFRALRPTGPAEVPHPPRDAAATMAGLTRSLSSLLLSGQHACHANKRRHAPSPHAFSSSASKQSNPLRHASWSAGWDGPCDRSAGFREVPPADARLAIVLPRKHSPQRQSRGTCRGANAWRAFLHPSAVLPQQFSGVIRFRRLSPACNSSISHVTGIPVPSSEPTALIASMQQISTIMDIFGAPRALSQTVLRAGAS